MKEIFRENYRGFAVSVFWQRPRGHSKPLSYGYHIEDELEVWGYGFSNTKAACRAAGKVIDDVHVPLRGRHTIKKPERNTMTSLQLPNWLAEELTHCPKAGDGVHRWLFRMARHLHWHMAAGISSLFFTAIGGDASRCKQPRQACRFSGSNARHATRFSISENYGKAIAILDKTRMIDLWRRTQSTYLFGEHYGGLKW